MSTEVIKFSNGLQMRIFGFFPIDSLARISLITVDANPPSSPVVASLSHSYQEQIMTGFLISPPVGRSMDIASIQWGHDFSAVEIRQEFWGTAS